MFKRLTNIFKSQVVKDLYFGEMGSTFDDYNNYYYLDKDIELEGVNTPVVLCIQTTNQKSNKRQQKAFELIKDDSRNVMNEVVNFLTLEESFISKNRLKKEFRLESITIPEHLEKNSIEWSMDFSNLKDGFTRIVVKMNNLKPIGFSVEG
tara:strand:- start:42802 stop:43251 length:450 start_codon:yes stop_codon:yes gene_type:complete